jgi:hypothetical protein
MSNNPTKTAEFYQENFGATLVSSEDLGNGRARIRLDLDGSTILVNTPREQPLIPEEPKIGLGHFGVRTDNLEAAVSELKSQGVEFVMEIREIKPGLKISYLLAPENVLIELQEGSV